MERRVALQDATWISRADLATVDALATLGNKAISVAELQYATAEAAESTAEAAYVNLKVRAPDQAATVSAHMTSTALPISDPYEANADIHKYVNANKLQKLGRRPLKLLRRGRLLKRRKRPLVQRRRPLKWRGRQPPPCK